MPVMMGRTKITSRPKPDAAKAAAAKKKKSYTQVQSSSAQVQSSSMAVAGVKHHCNKNDCLDDEGHKNLSSAQVQSSSVAVAGMNRQGDKNKCSDDERCQKKQKSDAMLLKHQRVVAEKRHSQKLSGSIQESDEESDKGDDSNHAASDASVCVTKVVPKNSEVDYGNDELFAKLAKIHKYYYDWRMQHCNMDVWDGSPAFINFSTSQFTEVLERRIHEEVHVNHNQVQPLLNYHHCSNHYYDPLPEIDKQFWSVEQWILL